MEQVVFVSGFAILLLLLQNQQQTPSKHHIPPMSHQPQFHPIHQNHHQPVHQNQHAAHFPQNHHCGPPSHLPEINHAHQSPTMSQHIACLQPLTGGHVGARLHVMVRLIYLFIKYTSLFLCMTLCFSGYPVVISYHKPSLSFCSSTHYK